MKENLLYQFRFYREAILITILVQVGLPFLTLLFASAAIYTDTGSPNQIMSNHLMAGMAGLTTGLSWLFHMTSAGVSIHLTTTYGNTRKNWFVVSAIMKIVFAIASFFSSFLVVLIVSKIISKEVVVLGYDILLGSFTSILLASCIGELCGIGLSHWGSKIFPYVFGGALGSGVVIGFMERAQLFAALKDFFSMPLLSSLGVVITYCILLFLSWQLIRKQEVKL